MSAISIEVGHGHQVPIPCWWSRYSWYRCKCYRGRCCRSELEVLCETRWPYPTLVCMGLISTYLSVVPVCRTRPLTLWSAVLAHTVHAIGSEMHYSIAIHRPVWPTRVFAADFDTLGPPGSQSR